MGKRGVINPNTGKTDGQLKSMIRSALRKVWRATGRKMFLESVQEPYVGKGKYRLGVRCALCGKMWGKSEKVMRGKKKTSAYNVDHIEECHEFLSLDDLSEYAKSLLMPPLSGYRILCTLGCHEEVTKKQTKERAKRRKK